MYCPISFLKLCNLFQPIRNLRAAVATFMKSVLRGIGFLNQQIIIIQPAFFQNISVFDMPEGKTKAPRGGKSHGVLSALVVRMSGGEGDPPQVVSRRAP